MCFLRFLTWYEKYSSNFDNAMTTHDFKYKDLRVITYNLGSTEVLGSYGIISGNVRKSKVNIHDIFKFASMRPREY